MSKHQKHTKLPLRNVGTFAVNEIAVLGSSCNVISDFVQTIVVNLASLKLTYIDASHNEMADKPLLNKYTFNENQTISIHKSINENRFENYRQFNQYDLTFINGNHYQGNHQLVIIDNEKEASLKKRVEQLTDVICFVLIDKNTAVFEFIKKQLNDFEKIPVYHYAETEAICKSVLQYYKNNLPILNGLVLIGGKSERMGSDKSLLNYHGTAQRDFLNSLLKKTLNTDVYLSSRKEQNTVTEHVISDSFIGLGPLGGICSAFMQFPNNAFLVVATDLPFIDESVLIKLINKRNPSKIATAFIGTNSNFPEPLITIWEPKAYPVLLHFLSLGYSCPRKVLLNSDVELVEIDEQFIRNINTPEEYNEAKNQLNSD